MVLGRCPRQRRNDMDQRAIIMVALAGLLLAAWYFLGRQSSGSRIDGAQARELVASGARLVDVRTPAEFGDGHLPGAINIPLQSLRERLDELTPRDRAVVVYCRSGRRSAMAATTLRKGGYQVVHDLGPQSAW